MLGFWEPQSICFKRGYSRKPGITLRSLVYIAMAHGKGNNGKAVINTPLYIHSKNILRFETFHQIKEIIPQKIYL